MSLVKEQAAFLLDVAKLINKATELGFVVTGGELARTPEQQAIYVKTGRSKTMNSIHLKRCAIDLNFSLAAAWDNMARAGVQRLQSTDITASAA